VRKSPPKMTDYRLGRKDRNREEGPIRKEAIPWTIYEIETSRVLSTTCMILWQKGATQRNAMN
jgi:hypothetical protein